MKQRAFLDESTVFVMEHVEFQGVGDIPFVLSYKIDVQQELNLSWQVKDFYRKFVSDWISQCIKQCPSKHAESDIEQKYLVLRDALRIICRRNNLKFMINDLNDISCDFRYCFEISHCFYGMSFCLFVSLDDEMYNCEHEPYFCTDAELLMSDTSNFDLSNVSENSFDLSDNDLLHVSEYLDVHALSDDDLLLEEALSYVDNL